MLPPSQAPRTKTRFPGSLKASLEPGAEWQPLCRHASLGRVCGPLDRPYSVNRLSALFAATWWLFLMALVGALAIGVFLAPFMGVVTFVALTGVFVYFAATRYDEEGHEHD